MILATVAGLNGDPVPPNISRLLQHPEAFDDLLHREVAVAICELRLAGKPVTAVEIEKLLGRVHREFIQGLMRDSIACSVEHAEYDAQPIWESYKHRQIAKLFAEGQAVFESSPDQAINIVAHVKSALDELTTDTLCGYTARPIGDILPPSDNADELLRHRFLCRGAGLLLCGPTGIGKTTLALELKLCFAIGRSCLGFNPTRPLRSLYIQAENDDGDLIELRDGIVAGLKFSAAERAQAFANVQVVTIDDLCGPEFLSRAVVPLCKEVKPDVLWLDPLLAYLGGDVSKQEVVSPWLRTKLNPILHRFGVSCVLIHHTNKPPTGKEKANWQAGDFAYIGSGSSELANWPRAVIAIRGTGSHDVFELRLGKRGSRVGWKEADGTTCYSRFIGHGSDGIYWREVAPDEIETGGRPKSYDPEEIFALLPREGLTTGDWQKLAKSECGLSEATFHRERRAFQKAERILKSNISGKWQPISKR